MEYAYQRKPLHKSPQANDHCGPQLPPIRIYARLGKENFDSIGPVSARCLLVMVTLQNVIG